MTFGEAGGYAPDGDIAQMGERLRVGPKSAQLRFRRRPAASGENCVRFLVPPFQNFKLRLKF